MSNNESDALRLVAKDEADIEVMSALLQDAIVAGADMHFDTPSVCFLMVADRFCWERPALEDLKNSEGGAVYERALCGVRISHVIEVHRHCWPTEWRDAFFNLLALKLTNMPHQSGANYTINLSFSGGPSLRMLVKKMDIVLGDLDSGRPTNLYPQHDI